MKVYDPSMFRAKRELLGISRKQLARETFLANETLRKAEHGEAIQRSTELLIGLVLDIIAARQGQTEEIARLERNWKNPKYRARFTQPLMEE